MQEPPVVVEPPAEADACVIWLHGLGADGRDFEPVVPYLGAALTRHTRFVFPHAPMRPVTVNGGHVMRAWYDIRALDLTDRADAEGVRDSAGVLLELLEKQAAAGISRERTVLAGFSQGGAIALHAGLRLRERVAGIMALSTYLPLPEATRQEATPCGLAVPVFMAHGRSDPVVPVSAGERSADFLRALGATVDLRLYDMEHSVCEQELADISAWLGQRLPTA